MNWTSAEEKAHEYANKQNPNHQADGFSTDWQQSYMEFLREHFQLLPKDVSGFFVLDLPGKNYPEELIAKLKDNADYKDQSLKEHLYGDNTFDELEEDDYTEDELAVIDTIREAMNLTEAAYVRFVF